MKSTDLTGYTFGHLRVLSAAGHRGAKRLWRCVCRCGTETLTQTSDLTGGKSKSCGCWQLERVTKHGATHHGAPVSPEYKCWQSMKTRCQNPRAAHYDRYGGRGIHVCERWRESFQAFREDLGPRPPLHTLERVDNDGHYEPGNVRWATRKEQAQNRHDNRSSFLKRQRDTATGQFL